MSHVSPCQSSSSAQLSNAITQPSCSSAEPSSSSAQPSSASTQPSCSSSAEPYSSSAEPTDPDVNPTEESIQSSTPSQAFTSPVSIINTKSSAGSSIGTTQIQTQSKGFCTNMMESIIGYYFIFYKYLNLINLCQSISGDRSSYVK